MVEPNARHSSWARRRAELAPLDERAQRPDVVTLQPRHLLRIDTPIEVDYYKHGGILPFVLRELLSL